MPLREATRRVTAALARLGLTPELRDASRDGEPGAWSCRLFGGDGTPVAEGMGKGRRAEARAGALFEALEHHLTGPALFDPDAVETAEAAGLAAGPLRREAVGVLLAAGPPGRLLACQRYRPPAGGEAIPVPVFLRAPWFAETHAGPLRRRAGDTCDYRHLMRYSSNSGSATGVTAAEALLHALNEAIERDALSLLLVRAFLAGHRPTVIDPATLPRGLACAHEAAGRVTGSPVHLLDITSDLGVPTMLAYTAPAAGRPHRRGAGTSLSVRHAAWRALTELVQTTAGETSPPREPAWVIDHPQLRACARLDLTRHLRGARVVPFGPGRDVPAHPRDQLSELTAVLSARGHVPYRRVVAVLPEGIVAAHAIVPGLERFVLIVGGNLVLPGPRGLALTREPRDTAAVMPEV